MAYALLTIIKNNLEMLPSDNSLDSVLILYAEEADAHIDSLLGNATALTTIPNAIRHAASKYAAGRYKMRIDENNMRAKEMIDEAEKDIMRYRSGIGRQTIFG